MPNQTGKQRAARIPLDYFKRSSRLEWWKPWWSAAAIASLAVASVAANGWLRGDAGRLIYSRGPLASVHATWDAQCEACHEPFAPIGREPWITSLVGQSWDSSQKCEACHRGPPHHANEKVDHTPNCVECHREHRGRDASLVRLPDRACTQCHGDLAPHSQPHDWQLDCWCHADLTAAMKQGQTQARFASRVTGFDADHPEFRVHEKALGDPGQLKFNHALHLSAGMSLTGQPQPNFTLGDIRDEQGRQRYRAITLRATMAQSASNSALVQLDCAACHQLDAADLVVAPLRAGGTGSGVTRDSGRYMLPIRYDKHCQACHPIDLPGLPVPHGLQPDALRAFLNNAYAGQYVQGKLAPAEGRPPFPTVVSRQVAETVGEFIDAKVRTAEQILYSRKNACAECHVYDGVAGVESSSPQHESGKQPDPWQAPERIVATAVPEVWLQHAVFDHSAHRAVRCLECHAAAEKSASHADVLLPDRDTCRRCHSRPRHEAGIALGGARFDCTECHRYHNADQPLAGIAAAARGARAKYDARQFILGVPHEQP